MHQGTTPTYTLTISGYDLTDKTVFVTVSSRGKKITIPQMETYMEAHT